MVLNTVEFLNLSPIGYIRPNSYVLYSTQRIRTDLYVYNFLFFICLFICLFLSTTSKKIFL